MTFFSFQQLVYEELFRIPGILESSSGIRRGEGIPGILESSSGIRRGGGEGALILLVRHNSIEERTKLSFY